MSFERNLHVCSEQDGLISNDSSSPVLAHDTRRVEEDDIGKEAQYDETDSDSEVNVISHKPQTDHVELNICTEDARPLHSL